MTVINYYSVFYRLSIIIWRPETLEHVAVRYLHLLRLIDPFEHLIEQNVMFVNAHWSIVLKSRYVKYLSFSNHFAVLECIVVYVLELKGPSPSP